jgi:hypothetical protein
MSLKTLRWGLYQTGFPLRSNGAAFCRVWDGMEQDPLHRSPETRLTEVLQQAARARRFARTLVGDPAAARLDAFADELMAEAVRIEAESR